VDIQELRVLTRLLKKWIGHITSEKNWIQKSFECFSIKLNTVIADVFGVLGRKLLKCLLEKDYVDEKEVKMTIHG
jgi:transposase